MRCFLALLLALMIVPVIPAVAWQEAAPPQQEAAELPGEHYIALAEEALRAGETQIAESEYKSAAADAWAFLGLVRLQEGDKAGAKSAYEDAIRSVSHPEDLQLTLALILMQTGEMKQAEALARDVRSHAPQNLRARQVLAQVLTFSGQPQEAIQELEEAREFNPKSIELLYMLGTRYLQAKDIPQAQKTFAEILKLRPIPETHVLLGRTYRDFGQFELAQKELETALASGKKLHRAHYYLGSIALLHSGIKDIGFAIEQFQDELRWFPEEKIAQLTLGMALVDQRRFDQAIPHLKIATGLPDAANAYQFLGEAYVLSEQPQLAEKPLRKALAIAEQTGAEPQQLSAIHYLLGQALKKLGKTAESADQFRVSEAIKTKHTREAREALSEYLSGESTEAQQDPTQLIDLSSLKKLTPAQLKELTEKSLTAIARAETNLGVLQAQAQNFAHAADYFRNAAEAVPDFPSVEYSLGLSYFNSQQFQKAIAPLQKAISTDSSRSTEIQRLLALCYLNTEQYSKAASLLAIDDARREDVSLEYAYALALVRSNQTKEAEQEFADLLSRHADSPELNVLIGQAHAQESDFENAIPYFVKALQQKADVKEAHSALGIIYMRQGKLDEAEKELRAELKLGPNPTAEFQLANVLDLQQKTEEARTLLQDVLKQKPDFADARYVLGKILLARGEAQQASENLEAAARISPEEPNIHYQLGQAYQRLGKTELAQEQFELFRKYKSEKRRPQ